MRRRSSSVVVRLGAAAALAGLVGTAGLAGTVPAVAAPTTPTTPAAAAPVRVTLPTGDHVQVGRLADGRASVDVLPADPSSALISRYTVGGHTFVVPAEARPFVGTVLDPSLFDVDRLAALGGPTSVPVTMTTGAAQPAVPGLTVTGRSGRTVTGVLHPDDPAAAAGWRSALTTAAARVSGPAHAAPAALFGSVTAMALVGSPTSTVTPAFQQYALNVRVLGVDGKPLSFGEIQLINTDDSRRYLRYVITGRTGSRVSVPAGHYAAVSQIDTYDDNGLTASRLVVVPDFTVRQDDQTLTVDARTATLQPSVTTPRPAAVQHRSVEIDRLSTTTGSPSLTWKVGVYGDTVPLYVSPTPPAVIGRMYVVTGFQSTAAPATGNPYGYDLSFVDERQVPATLAKQVQAFQLADVRSTYYSDAPRDAQKARTPVYPFEAYVSGDAVGFSVPSVRDEYVYGPAGTPWTDQYQASPVFDNPYGGTVFDVPRIYPAGSTTPITWMRGPLAPDVPQQAGDTPPYNCPECRTATRMTVELAELADTTPGHAGIVYSFDGSAKTHFALYRGSQLISSGDNVFRADDVAVPSAPAVYRMHLDVDRSGEGTVTSTATSTDVTFASSATNGGALPTGWECALAGSCSVIPMLSANVPLPTDLDSRMPVGRNAFTLKVGAFVGAPALTVNGAALEVSPDAGATWVQVPLTRAGNGIYRAALVNKAAWAGKAVSTRLTATTADGGSLVQTTTAAYFVASA